jgi:glycine C-acetyltransferase
MAERSAFAANAAETVDAMAGRGLLKRETALASAQSGRIAILPEAEGGAAREVVNLCANNYLGLADHPDVVAAAQEALAEHGFGLAAARLISGTHTLHRRLERRLADYLQREDALLFLSAFDANLGLFEALLGPEDAVVSDALNHASIIDGIRLCPARRLRYASSDMDDLRRALIEARAGGSRFVLIVTDGVFSMDGHLARLPEIARLAREHGAVVMVDDCHATGVVGRRAAAPPTTSA